MFQLEQPSITYQFSLQHPQLKTEEMKMTFYPQSHHSYNLVNFTVIRNPSVKILKSFYNNASWIEIFKQHILLLKYCMISPIHSSFCMISPNITSNIQVTCMFRLKSHTEHTIATQLTIWRDKINAYPRISKMNPYVNQFW